MAGEAWASAAHSATKQSTAHVICNRQTGVLTRAKDGAAQVSEIMLLVAGEDLINLQSPIPH